MQVLEEEENVKGCHLTPALTPGILVLSLFLDKSSDK